MITNHQCIWTGNTNDPLTMATSWTIRRENPDDVATVAAIVAALEKRIATAKVDVFQADPATFTVQLTLYRPPPSTRRQRRNMPNTYTVTQP
jgi:hypothetical protein